MYGSIAGILLPVALAALTIYFGFEAGGYFADTTGWVAAGLAATLALAALLLGRPPAGITRPLLAAGAALALFGLWTLLSALWSDATSRALIEFDRVLLYLGALLVFGAAPSPARTLRRLPAAFVLAAVVLAAAGLIVRTLPDQWPFSLPPATTRMSYPLSYANALGALAALGLPLALHLASWRHSAALTRVLASAALPVLAATLVLTFSRGATVAAFVAVLAYLGLGATRGMPTALLASAPFMFVAARAAYDADLLATPNPRTPAALAQGEDLAVEIALAAAGAAVLMAVLVALERPLGRLRLPRVGRRGRVVAAAAVVLCVIGAGAAAVASGEAGDLYDAVARTNDTGRQQLTRERLTNPSTATDLRAQNRPKYWAVAVDAFEEHPLRGSGAGTFANLWAQDRPVHEDVAEGHSVYIETLGELGVVGAVLIAGVLSATLWPFAAGLRGGRRPLYAALLAASVGWLLHAGLDWDWEMPALSLWLFAAGGSALALTGRSRRRGDRPSWGARIAVAAACVLAALTPASVALSQARLDRSADALERGDCRQAKRSAHDSRSVLDVRPEPYEILAYCAVRDGRPRRAASLMARALERDPDNWRLFYGLSLVRAAAGRDPRPAARAARARNPLEPLTQDAMRRFATDDPRAWRRRARDARLPFRASGPSR